LASTRAAYRTSRQSPSMPDLPPRLSRAYL
jgi:hypothetical protein